ncbi:MAG: hypothetical protein DRG35_06255 [Deltaproteobacteria bacterium]|nr:MAG: hypothetical protein DRG35_06255 [Deltaproteobacteria bacterium]
MGHCLRYLSIRKMVPFWKMITGKRIDLQRKTAPAAKTDKNHNRNKRLQRLFDSTRFRYPLKLDYGVLA